MRARTLAQELLNATLLVGEGAEVFYCIHNSRRPLKRVRIEDEPLTVAEAAKNKKPKKRIVLS